MKLPFARFFGFTRVLRDRAAKGREPQDAAWPGERVVVWSYPGRTTLVDVLPKLGGAFGPDEIVVTDLGEGDFSDLVDVARGHRSVRALPIERVGGVATLALPRTFLTNHANEVRKLLWLLPFESIYFVAHESIDVRSP